MCWRLIREPLAPGLSCLIIKELLLRWLRSHSNSISRNRDYAYTVGEVTWLVRNEMPRTLEDVLARRLRILFLDARAAMAMAPKVAGILATEWGKDETWTSAQVKAFNEVASNYILN